MKTIEELSGSFLDQVAGRHGELARPNNTHFSHCVVSQAIAHLRRQICSGQFLTPKGERFVASAAAYLALLTIDSYQKRGFSVSCDASYEHEAADNRLIVMAERQRNGVKETYQHDILKDVILEVLHPKQYFQSMKGRVYILTSLELPTPEYLYLSGVHFMLSPHSTGNWPAGEGMLGLDKDFAAARELLIDDLHTDIKVAINDPALRKLSHWVVFPFYGWEMNDGQEYNLMTLIEQICFKRVISETDAIEYLRCMLFAQCYHLRNLAARTLMILKQPPRSIQEGIFYGHALNNSDIEFAKHAMARFSLKRDQHGKEASPDAAYLAQKEQEWKSLRDQAPQEEFWSHPIFEDPQYDELGQLGGTEPQRQLELTTELAQRYPGNWFAEVALATAILRSGKPEEGEALLRTLMEKTPGSNIAHYALSAHYWTTDRFDLADKIYLEMVKRWPWDFRVIHHAMWSNAREMLTSSPQESAASAT